MHPPYKRPFCEAVSRAEAATPKLLTQVTLASCWQQAGEIVQAIYWQSAEQAAPI